MTDNAQSSAGPKPSRVAIRVLRYWIANLSALPGVWRSAGRSGVSRTVGVKWVFGDLGYSILRFRVEMRFDRLLAWDRRRRLGLFPR